MAKFGPGNKGRPKGAKGKLTTVFKEAVMIAYQGIGGDTAFTSWAEKNPTEFYKIASRLIPQEVAVQGQMRPLVIDLVTSQDVTRHRETSAEPSDD